MDWERHFRSMKRGTGPSFGAEYGMGCGADFGVLERGIPVPGQPVGTVVIRPGRYWLDAFGDKRKVLTDWFKSKPEIHVETTEEDIEGNPPRLFAVFTVPQNANNFNLNGVWFPIKDLGFPTVADATVQSSDDTVQRPAPPTVTSTVSEIASSAGQIGSSLVSGISTGTIVKFALIGGLVLLIATLPGQALKALPRHV